MYRDFIPYEQALALKDLKFDEPCPTAYRNTDGEQLLMGFSMWKNFTIHDNHDGFATRILRFNLQKIIGKTDIYNVLYAGRIN